MRRMLWLVSLLGTMTTAHAAPPPAAWTQPARYKFEYRADFSGVSVATGKRLRLWLPFPAATADQQVLSAEIDAPWPYRRTSDALGNQFVYLEGDGVPAGAVTMRVVVERRPSPGVRLADVKRDTPADPSRYLQPQQLVPLDGVIRDLAVQQSKGLTSDHDKARAFYDYVVKNMRYNKDGAGWGRGDAIWACTNKRGNCTDFHSLFIGMARSQGVPARFFIGFPIPSDGDSGTIGGYHCWAEYYDAQRGWVPLDASEANKSGQPDSYFGTLPNDRIQFSGGRDLVLTPPQQSAPLNYFIYPYAEVDGAPVSGIATTFHFERLAAGGAGS